MSAVPDDMWSFRVTAPATLSSVRVPAPDPDRLLDGQVMVRFEAGGLCGSDYSYFRGAHADVVATADPGSYEASLPGASLHEIVGEVVVSRDADIRTGRRVVGWATAMNGLSEYVVTNGSSLLEYEGGLPPSTAVMIQPLACVLYAVDRIATLDPVVAVLGLGPIGLLFAHVLASRGAVHVVGVDRVDRSDVAKRYGVDEFVHSTCDRWALGLDADARPDVVVEAIGHQVSTLGAAISAAAPSGEILYFGVPDDDVYPISMVDMLRKDLTLRSGTTWDRRNSLRRAAGYLEQHPDLCDGYVTHVFAVDDAQRAYETATRPASGQLKVVLDATGAASSSSVAGKDSR